MKEKIFLAIAVIVAVICAGCAHEVSYVPQGSVFQPPASINTPGVYQQMPFQMEPVKAIELMDSLLAYAPEEIHENDQPLNWKGN